MFKFSYFLILLLLSSCVSMHVPSNHAVPSITQKNQIEAEFSAGSSLSANAAYSPLNHLSLMVNLQTLPKINSPTYHRSGEFALGYYTSSSKIVFGVNAGFGIGAYNWEYSQTNDTSSYTLVTIGDFQKASLQSFIAFTDNSAMPRWFAGFSFKANYFLDNFSSLNYSYEAKPGFTGLKTNTTFEPCFFTRNFISNKLYINGQAGLNISYDESMYWPTQYLFLRIGVGFKLGAKAY